MLELSRQGVFLGSGSAVPVPTKEPDVNAADFTRRELYAMYAAAHAKAQPLLKGDLLSAFKKIEQALNSSAGPDPAVAADSPSGVAPPTGLSASTSGPAGSSS